MPRMLRATIEEAALTLGVPPSVIELRIRTGTLVPCQDPSFRSCVWIREASHPEPHRPESQRPESQRPESQRPESQRPESQRLESQRKAGPGRARETDPLDPAGPAGQTSSTPDISPGPATGPAPRPGRRARAAPKKDIPTGDLECPGRAQPAGGTGTVRAATASPEAGPKPGADRPGRNNRGTRKNPATNNGADPGQVSRETRLLRDTIAMLKAELEIRDEQLDLLSIQLDLSRQEVRNLRPLLSRQLDLGPEQFQGPNLWLGSTPSLELANDIDSQIDSQIESQIESRTESPGPHLPMPAATVADQTSGFSVPGTLFQPPVPVRPPRAARPSHDGKFSRSLRPLVAMICLGFSLPLFH